MAGEGVEEEMIYELFFIGCLALLVYYPLKELSVFLSDMLVTFLYLRKK